MVDQDWIKALVNIPISHAVGVVAASTVIYFLSSCFYNLYLHPLRKIPGPKLAAIGPYLEFYHEVIRDGQYLWEIAKMHDKYGPIVRVNDKEVHIRDPSYYSTIYTAGARKTNKDPATVGAFDVPTATAATVDHDHHRARRGYLNPYFSKRSITNLEPFIHERVTKLLSRFQEHLDNDQVLSLDGAFCALTADVITSRFYGKHYNYLDLPDFHFVVRDGFLGLTKVYHLARFIPVLVTVLKRLPYSCLRLIAPSVSDLLQMRNEIHERGGDEFLSSKTSEAKSSILFGALADTHIPPVERTVERMLDEGTVILFAGTETTSRTLAITFFYLLTHPECLRKLREELNSLPKVEGDRFPLATLENLPYLNGVVHEGFRLAFGPISRSGRVATQENLKYKEHVIPAGTPVSQSTYFMHTDPKIFPEPEKFKPERWIEAAEKKIPLKKYITNFSQGSRQCIGYTMAFAEMYLAMSRIARAYDVELYDTTKADIDMTHARIVAYPKAIPGKTEHVGEIRVKVLKAL
ncbi:cytochrome p450 [Fusarium sporotrichioides]|uniref:Cytochrome P450 monooxygenase TRI4 n=2 Tax=Fusarium sporotrichioides TaxID=5514 RepID=TRI4_FUSSP|nr:RecName: Full=Cytochrome P450 monooxygenase TRI4; AltName: Full=Core trichothecene cluster (CTC) protein 4 [Fusarium sporotrichioides]AAK33073.1 cytochrome P450 [Fusarium sporotrichioides]RGP67090.1 cytochrome p450 [Fusarium sporotrichioides]